jgi:rubrerythrin
MSTVTTEEILRKAVHFEEISHNFYRRLQETVLDYLTKNALDFLAREELKHKEFLEQYIQGKVTGPALGLNQVHDSKIVEAFTVPPVIPELMQKDAFLVAAEKEKASHEFYLELAELHPEGPVKDLLKQLAQEELGHKEKVEYLYSNAAFPQTSGG